MTKKTLHQLQKHQLLASKSGQHGGYALSCNPDQVSVLQVIEWLEGLPTLVACNKSDNDCTRSTQCQMKKGWQHLYQDILDVFSLYTLSDLLSQPETLPWKTGS